MILRNVVLLMLVSSHLCGVKGERERTKNRFVNDALAHVSRIHNLSKLRVTYLEQCESN